MVKKVKEEGQVFTPPIVVTMILDSIKYEGQEILNKTIMEPSFGEGVFLIEIVERIIKEAKNKGIENKDIENILNSNVYGIEQDFELFNKCIENLNIVLETHFLKKINWDNLINGDTTIEYKKHLKKHDYVVGNPPYVRIHNFSKELIKNTKDFQFIDGDTDLYICFYEMGIKMLKESGKLGYITPNSFMKNSSQKKFRNYIIDNEYLQSIYDFKTSEIFKGFNTYTCICILNKDKYRHNKRVYYREYNMYDIVVENVFDYKYFKEQLNNKAWNLSSKDDIEFLETNRNKPIKLGDISIVQNGVATNKDNVYIGFAYEDIENKIPYMGKHTDKKKFVYFNNEKIESTILHRCVKASKYDGVMSNLYILFPYKYKDISKCINENKKLESNYIPILEEELKKKYPNAYRYLEKNKNVLIKRDMDRNAEWYVFGRSQGLLNMPYKKIVFKHIINKDNPILIPYILDEDVVIYSGLYTTININTCVEKDKNKECYYLNQSIYEKELNEILNIFKEDDFKRYLVLVGKDMSGGYIGISSKHIQGYGTN